MITLGTSNKHDNVYMRLSGRIIEIRLCKSIQYAMDWLVNYQKFDLWVTINYMWLDQNNRLADENWNPKSLNWLFEIDYYLAHCVVNSKTAYGYRDGWIRVIKYEPLISLQNWAFHYEMYNVYNQEITTFTQDTTDTCQTRMQIR